MSYIPTSSGTYTPTLTSVQNIIASTAYVCQWVRVRELITVSGKVDIDPDLANTSTRLGVSLPFASALAGDYELAGVASCPNVANLVAAILGDDTNDRAQIQYETSDASNRSFYFTFTYKVI